MSRPAPIALFAYNRPHHTRMCVESLLRNPQAAQSDLFVFSDGWKGPDDKPQVLKVREYAGHISGFKSVTVSESPANRGLARSVIAGVTEVVNRFGRIIVVEDDLLFSPHFLEFMNRALDIFENDENVGNVHGHLFRMHGLPDTFLISHADSWGWATWKRAWQLFEPSGAKLLDALRSRNLLRTFDFDGAYPFSEMLKKQIAGKNNSWAIRWKASLLINGKLSVNAGKSLVANNGFDETGTNCGGGELLPTDLYEGDIECFRPGSITENAEARRSFKRMYRRYYNKFHKALVKARFIVNKMKHKTCKP